MEVEGNARKRQRRNAIRPNSIEAQAIRTIADEYTTRSAIEVVENLSITDDNNDDEVIIAQMQPSLSFSTATVQPPSVAVAAPAPRSSNAIAILFPDVEEVPFVECRRESSDIETYRELLAVATAVPVNQSPSDDLMGSVCVSQVIFGDEDEDSGSEQAVDVEATLQEYSTTGMQGDTEANDEGCQQ